MKKSRFSEAQLIGILKEVEKDIPVDKHWYPKHPEQEVVRVSPMGTHHVHYPL